MGVLGPGREGGGLYRKVPVRLHFGARAMTPVPALPEHPKPRNSRAKFLQQSKTSAISLAIGDTQHGHHRCRRAQSWTGHRRRTAAGPLAWGLRGRCGRFREDPGGHQWRFRWSNSRSPTRHRPARRSTRSSPSTRTVCRAPTTSRCLTSVRRKVRSAIRGTPSAAISGHMRDRVAVDSDMFVYYISRDDDGQPVRAVVAPDVFVVFGVPDRLDRRSYVLWREPDAEIRFVLEIASASTRRRDHTVKRDVYASLGVREYFLFRPARASPPGKADRPKVAQQQLPRDSCRRAIRQPTRHSQRGRWPRRPRGRGWRSALVRPGSRSGPEHLRRGRGRAAARGGGPTKGRGPSG